VWLSFLQSTLTDLPLASVVTVRGGIHVAACLFLFFYLGGLARSKDRAFFWAALGPIFWSATSLMFWSLSGADIYIMGVIGGVFGALPAYAIVFALDSGDALRRVAELEAAATAQTKETASKAPVETQKKDTEEPEKQAAPTSAEQNPNTKKGKKKKNCKKDKQGKASKEAQDEGEAVELSPEESEKDAEVDTKAESVDQEVDAAKNTETKANENSEPDSKDQNVEPGQPAGSPVHLDGLNPNVLCPSCQSPGRKRDDLYLCSNTSCNNEFFEFEAYTAG
jgi:flagellar biosynthesis GTPase FlhF